MFWARGGWHWNAGAGAERDVDLPIVGADHLMVVQLHHQLAARRPRPDRRAALDQVANDYTG